MSNPWKTLKMFTSACITFLLISAVFCGDDNHAKLRFFHGSFENYTEWSIYESQNIFSSSWYNSSLPTTIFCHGFTGHPKGPAVTAIISAYLEQGQSNVAFLNWERLAASIYNSLPNSYINWAVPNALKLGVEFADVLVNMSAAGLDLNKTHLVGHSLGAHIVGIAGNRLAEKGVLLSWIIGLDPARYLFDSMQLNQKLNPNSAKYVVAIHSDPSRYGTRREVGTVDFWPNFRNAGPVVQPGCDNRAHPRFSPEDLCNHNKCWQYLIDAMKYPGSVLGSYAKNFRTWKNYNKSQRTAVVIDLGKYYDEVVPGNYYFVTAAHSPHGLAENGL